MCATLKLWKHILSVSFTLKHRSRWKKRFMFIQMFLVCLSKNVTKTRQDKEKIQILGQYLMNCKLFLGKKILTSNSGFCNYYYFLMSINTFPVKAAYMLFCNICKRLNLIVIQYLYLHPQLTVSLDINLKLSFDKINIFLNLLVHVVSL